MNSNTSQHRIEGLNGFSQTLTTGIDRTCRLCLWSVVGPEKRKNAGGQDSKEEVGGSNVMSVFEKSRGVKVTPVIRYLCARRSAHKDKTHFAHC